MTRAVLAVLLALISAAPCAAEVAGTEVTVPLSVRGMLGERTVNLVATEHRPAGAGPFPAIVLSHGSPNSAADRVGDTAKFPVASEVFVQWGFVVLNPVRRGYGKTGVDRERIVLVGQSAGGWGSLAAATEADLPIRGVINFAGGRGGKQGGIANNNCAPDRLVAAAGTLGKRTRVPTLWLYTTNDQFFAPELSRRMSEAYTDGGGRAAYHLLPAIGNDGHGLINMKDGVSLWEDKVTTFLREIGVLAR